MRIILLPRNHIAKVDDSDYPLLVKCRWSLDNNNYPCRKVKGKIVRMHNMILKAPPGKVVDHIDRDPTNNQRSNLRIATYSENCCNRKLRVDNKTGYRGVCWHKHKAKYQVRIIKNRKIYCLGYVVDPVEGAKRYNEAAKKLHGKFAILNEVKK